MKGGFPYQIQIQYIYKWRNNHPKVLKEIQMVQNHTSKKFQPPVKMLAQVQKEKNR